MLFQVDTRARLSELAAALGRKATLDDITEVELDRLASDWFAIISLLGCWHTDNAAGRVCPSDGSGSRGTSSWQSSQAVDGIAASATEAHSSKPGVAGSRPAGRANSQSALPARGSL